MADKVGGGSGPSSTRRPGGRRASTDPASSPNAMDERPSTDRDAPKVRFPEDIDRPTTSPSASAQAVRRPGTPNLTINTAPGPKTSNEGTSSPSRLAPLAAANQLSPTSPRTRDRGYSLRRTLFARGISSQSANSGVELGEAGSSREHERNAAEMEEGRKVKQSAASISPVVEDVVDVAGVQHGSGHPQSFPRKTSEKKTFGTISLPHYDVWARKQAESNKYLKEAKRFYKEKIIKGLLRQRDTPPSKDGRHIPIDASRKEPLIDERTGKGYVGNAIRSSRYTAWNFLPRQLFFQFSKLANAYFLLISILQMIPGLSTTGTYTTIAPLMVFVAISMAKEGYDDYRRYKLDKVENNRETKVLLNYRPNQGRSGHLGGSALKDWIDAKGRSKLHVTGSKGQNGAIHEEIIETTPPSEDSKLWKSLKWKDVQVGDIIKLDRDDAVPADLVLIHATGPNGIAYIETMALDGETNLKSKQAATSLAKRCSTVDEIAACRAQVVVEDPNIDLYNFDGRITVDGETLPLTTNEVVFRGSTLRNTTSAIGIIINSGEECKIRMNANKNPRIKAPAIQTITNKIVIALVIFVVLLSLFCTIGYQIWSNDYEDKAWYLRDASVPFSQIIIGFIILYNTLIPLSLYVSLEIIKVGQFIFMNDIEMYDPISNTPMTCNTTTILENLGQVSYIFSDKTGTLTDNIMRFRKLSVAGYAWLHDFDLQKEAAEVEQSKREAEDKTRKKGKGVARHFKKKIHIPKFESTNISARDSSTMAVPENPRRSSVSAWKSSARPANPQPEFRTEELLRFMQHKPHSVFTKKAKFFLLSLALCHTCLPEVKENGDIDFQAASPDELALVRAAQELGWLLIDRPAQSITLTYPGSPDSPETVTETYTILDVIEFSSKRKRMSIIVRFPNGKICIFCKGADSAILPRLKLASLALQKVSEVSRRASIRKSLEAEEALRRLSEHSPRTSFSRPSVALSRPSMSRRSTGYGRPSMQSTRLHPIRDDLDSWLRRRESDVEIHSDDIAAYQSPRSSPRSSMGQLSFSSSERRDSTAQDAVFDDLVDEAVVLDEAAVFERCFQHIDDFATEGLRTLLFGYRFLDEQEYDGWKKLYLDATTSLVDRQQLIENAGEMIEQNFDLAGATAIEDKLQKGVPETIDKLRRANIKIWMLTGDKRETAINIAHSARLCKNYSVVVILDHTTGEVEQRMATTLLDISKGTIPHSVIVVDGQTLSEIDANETLSLLFFDLAVLADSVICCRASPSQKASLVKKIRTKVNRSITLAIGDGANDIAMIQEAHVGIGISGKEGLQAARISDYSIAQFRFLQRLLLVHGRWNYVRTGKYILATFWKELVFYLIQALYQWWVGYTGTSLFESTSLTVFNTLFTSLAVILLGIFEQDLNASTLLAVPELYVSGQRNEAFNIKKYLAWMVMASSEAVIIYFCMYGLFIQATTFNDNDDVMSAGTLCFAAAVIFINIKLLILEMHSKTYIPLAGWFITVAGWWAWTVALSGLMGYGSTYPLYSVKDNFIYHFGRSLLWWLVLFLTLASVTLLELGLGSVRKAFWPSDTELFQVLQNDPICRAKFEDAVRREEESMGKGNTGVGELETGVVSGIDGDAKSSAEVMREDEIQELLSRPRVMEITSGNTDTEVLRSPVEVVDGVAMRRKFSVDVGSEEIELREREKKGTRK